MGKAGGIACGAPIEAFFSGEVLSVESMGDP